MSTTETIDITAPANTNSTGDRVLVGLSHGADEPENVLIAYLMGVEALRAGKDAALWLTKEGASVAVDGFAASIDIPGAPAVADLHDEYVDRGGRIIACPVCIKLRDIDADTLVPAAEVAGAPTVYEYTADGALVFNY